MALRSLVLALPFCAFIASGARAQEAGPSLTQEILRQDSLAFAAFNRHDLGALLTFFAQDLEFLHDKDGALALADVENGFRSLFAQDNGLRRELVAEASEVYPVPGFGAIQLGRHRFCHDENGEPDCGTFGFTHVWRWTGDRWEIARILSYAH